MLGCIVTFLPACKVVSLLGCKPLFPKIIPALQPQSDSWIPPNTRSNQEELDTERLDSQNSHPHPSRKQIPRPHPRIKQRRFSIFLQDYDKPWPSDLKSSEWCPLARMGGRALKERLGSGWISQAMISRIRTRTAATSKFLDPAQHPIGPG